MKNNIIVTGCSYSTKAGVHSSYVDLLKLHLKNTNVTNLAWPGQSNDTIIRNVKEQIRYGVTDTLFICQLTHLHRVSHFCHINQKWLDFQPAYVNTQPLLKDDKLQFEVKFWYKEKNRPPLGKGNHGAVGIYGATKHADLDLSDDITNELLDWYEKYLFYLYDDSNTFVQLSYKLDELSKQVLDSGNEILYLYWPEVLYDSTLFDDNNFLSIDGEYSMLKWSTKNKLTQKKDSHLSLTGHYKLLNNILRYITNTDVDIKTPII